MADFYESVLAAGIKPGEAVDTGYCYTMVAPAEPGMYRLIDVSDENNCHIECYFEKE